jgi:hypothetical protein
MEGGETSVREESRGEREEREALSIVLEKRHKKL